jgi:hypothetical protein
MAARAPRPENAPVAGEAAPVDGEKAGAIALAPLAYNEAPRVGVLGDSGCGKTEAMRRLVAAYLRSSAGVVLIVDDKEARAQFPGQERRDRAELERRKPDPTGPRAIVFRGDRFAADGGVDAESIAALQWQLAQRNRPSLVVYDELDRAAVFGQWKAGKDSKIGWAFGKGRSVGAASLWGTQETEAVPREAFNQSSVLLVFRMTGNPVRLLKQRGYCEGGADAMIPRLPGDELPPAQRGYFVLLRRGRPWDGSVYRFGSAK